MFFEKYFISYFFYLPLFTASFRMSTSSLSKNWLYSKIFWKFILFFGIKLS